MGLANREEEGGRTSLYSARARSRRCWRLDSLGGSLRVLARLERVWAERDEDEGGDVKR